MPDGAKDPDGQELQRADPMPRYRDTAAGIPDLPASLQVYEALRARIVSLSLAPGARLSRPELAEQFGVSASPLREALLRLERDGLIATFRQSRTVVTHIDPGQVKREHFLRTAIECEVVNALAAKPDKSVLSKAAAIIRMQRVLLEDAEQMEMFRKLDEDFHRELFEAAEQGDLHRSLLEQSSQMARLRSIDLPSEGKSASVVEGHARVMEAIQASDRHGATDAMRGHLSGTISRLEQIMAQHPQFFVAGGEGA